MAGYSGTPLSKKLGIKPGTAIYAIDAPPGYRTLLAPLPDDVTFAARLSTAVDVVHVFATAASSLAKTLPRLRNQMRADCVVWAGQGAIEGLFWALVFVPFLGLLSVIGVLMMRRERRRSRRHRLAPAA